MKHHAQGATAISQREFRRVTIILIVLFAVQGLCAVLYYGSTDASYLTMVGDGLWAGGKGYLANYLGMSAAPAIVISLIERIAPLFVFPVWLKLLSLASVAGFAFALVRGFGTPEAARTALLLSCNAYLFAINGLWGQLDAFAIVCFCTALLLLERYKSATLLTVALLLSISISLKMLPLVFTPLIFAWLWREQNFGQAAKLAAMTAAFTIGTHAFFLLVYGHPLVEGFVTPLRYSIGPSILLDRLFGGENGALRFLAGFNFLRLGIVLSVLAACVIVRWGNRKPDLFLSCLGLWAFIMIFVGPRTIPPYMEWYFFLASFPLAGCAGLPLNAKKIFVWGSHVALVGISLIVFLTFSTAELPHHTLATFAANLPFAPLTGTAIEWLSLSQFDAIRVFAFEVVMALAAGNLIWLVWQYGGKTWCADAPNAALDAFASAPPHIELRRVGIAIAALLAVLALPALSYLLSSRTELAKPLYAIPGIHRELPRSVARWFKYSTAFTVRCPPGADIPLPDADAVQPLTGGFTLYLPVYYDHHGSHDNNAVFQGITMPLQENFRDSSGAVAFHIFRRGVDAGSWKPSLPQGCTAANDRDTIARNGFMESAAASISILTVPSVLLLLLMALEALVLASPLFGRRA